MHMTTRQQIPLREAIQIAPHYVAEITGFEPQRLTAVEPTDDGGWIVEAEIVEESRLPSSADMLALYEIELDAEGDLLAVSRTRRYMRTEGLSASRNSEYAANGDAME